MSQFPPPPPGQGYPPMPPGQPGIPYGNMPAPRTTSGAAITSLICGILGCIPFVTSLIAIITGFIGIKSTSRPNVGGRGLAITGLILGFIGIIGWTAGTFFFVKVGKEAYAAITSGQQFTTDVMNGNFANAAQYTTSSLTQKDLENLRDQMKDWGSLTDMQIAGVDRSATLGGNSLTVNGKATFATAGQKDFSLVLTEENGKLKIAGVEFK